VAQGDSEASWYRDPLQLLAAVMLAAVVATCLSAFVPWGWIVAMKTPDWIAAAGALASMAAAVVALWLGLNASGRAETEAISKANLVAAQVQVFLQVNLQRFNALESAIMFRSVDDPSPDSEVMAFAAACAAPVRRPELEMLTWLIPLPNHCAGRVARAFALLEVLQEQVSGATIGANAPAWGSEAQKEGLLKMWNPMLSEAVRLLTVTEFECRKASALGGPSPTGEELYGPGDSADDY
jgi:hypothetical protein